MEHSPNVQPMRRRERFSFEAFDALIAEALDPTTDPQPDSLPVAPQGEVIDLNANVVELRPPDDAA